MEQKKETILTVQKNADQIRDYIRQDAAAEAKQIMTAAREDAARILEETSAKTHREHEILTMRFEHEVKLLRERFLSTLNLEKRKMMLQAKSSFIDDVFLRVRRRAAEYRANPRYREFLLSAAGDGIRALASDAVEVVYSLLDAPLVTKAFEDAVRANVGQISSHEISVRFIQDTFSDIGCLVRSSDGHLVCDNRFMARFDRMKEEFRSKLLKEGL